MRESGVGLGEAAATHDLAASGVAKAGRRRPARQDDTGADAEIGQFQISGFGQGVQGGLAGAIERQQGQGSVGRAGPDVDDGTRALLAHTWQHCLHHRDGPEQIGVEDAMYRLHRRAFDHAQPADAGVVDQNVDGTRGGDRRGDVVSIGDVQREHP